MMECVPNVMNHSISVTLVISMDASHVKMRSLSNQMVLVVVTNINMSSLDLNLDQINHSTVKNVMRNFQAVSVVTIMVIDVINAKLICS